MIQMKGVTKLLSLVALRALLILETTIERESTKKYDTGLWRECGGVDEAKK